MTTINIRAAAFLVLLFCISSCKKDYLEYTYPIDGTLVESEIFGSDRHARGLLNTVYFGLGNTMNRFGNIGNTASEKSLEAGRFGEFNGEVGFAAGSDEAVSANTGSSINILTNGSWGPNRVYDEFYGDAYYFLRKANLFIEKAPTSAISPVSAVTDLVGQAYFLRAFYHFELMKRYGSFILATSTFQFDENLDVPKNTFDEVVAQIVSDCNKAATDITAISQTQYSAGEKGRATKAAALALKSRTLLYAASPLNNPTNDLAKWQAAADAAQEFITVTGSNHGLAATAIQYQELWNFTTQPYNREVIFAAQPALTNQIDRTNSPPSYDNALGRTNPTQDLVDAFEMKTTGLPPFNPDGTINTASGYNAANPYANRDDRLTYFINGNGQIWWTGSPAIQTYEGGKDRISVEDRVTQTGYYMRKFLANNVRWSGSVSTARRYWVFFRYAEILLNQAEALNEAQGPAAALASINLVRQRVSLPALQISNPAGNGYVAPSKEAMRARIQNERRVELCFEDHRFFDVRRWKLGEQLFNKPVRGVVITSSNGSATGTMTYNYVNVQNRVFDTKMYRFPFPQTEINKTTKLVQNAGW